MAGGARGIGRRHVRGANAVTIQAALDDRRTHRQRGVSLRAVRRHGGLIAVIAAGVCLLSAVACRRIEHLLPEHVRRTPRGAHVELEPAVPGEGIPAGSAG